MLMPQISCYWEPSGKNAMVVYVATVVVWYSYRTPIAFCIKGQTVVRENDWGPTTGRHLNEIDGGSKEAKAARVSATKFQELWNERVAKV